MCNLSLESLNRQAKAVLTRTKAAYKSEGISGVARRAIPFTRHVGSVMAAKAGFSRPPSTSLVVLVDNEVSLAQVVQRLMSGPQPRHSWIRELLIVSYGPEVLSVGDLGSHRVHHHHICETDLTIAANFAFAQAHGDYIAFVEPEDVPINPTELWFRAASVHRPDVLVRYERGESPRSAETTEAGLANRGMTQMVVRRRAFIEMGLLHPEHPSPTSDLLGRLWRFGYYFSFVEPNAVGWGSAPAAEVDAARASDRPVRVVYVVNGTDVRGGIRIVFEHANRLRDEGLEAMIVTFGPPTQDWFPDLRAPLLHIRDFPPTDVAIATYWLTAEFVSTLDCARYYFIQHDESLFEDDQKWKDQVHATYKLPLEFVTISSWLVDHIRNLSGKESVLVPNGINREMFYPDPSETPRDKVRILVEGNKDIFWKGMPESAEALDGRDVEVWSLGNTGLKSDREFKYPPQDELRRIYSDCDILLKTSWYEGMPLPHMEAMACGCALLTTSVPGVRDYCIDGVNCLTAPARDVPAITAALTRLVTDSDLREELIKNALRTSEDCFGWEHSMPLLAQTFRSAAQTARQKFAETQTPA